PRASLASCLTVLARRTPRSTLVPYTTLFRSLRDEKPVQDAGAGRRIYRGSAGRIKRWEPVDPEQETDRTDAGPAGEERTDHALPDRKSTRLNSSHVSISYAVFCLKKKKQISR